MEELELLAPAGNFTSLKAAVENGADAVYMGLDNFNARKMTENFGIEEFKEAILYAHKRNVKIYITMNILMYDEELEEAIKSLIVLYKNGLDGVIVQDLGLAKLIHNIIPDLPLHASTQMTVHNLKQVRFLENLGFSRVVLAREMTIPEIENICKNTKLEIEVFVHGALCVCYSGQCLLSSMIGKRSGNRGSCAQPCRARYTLANKEDKKIIKNINLLSKKDIYGIDHIEALKNAGVKSLKVEGRNKVPEYVATVISKYIKKIDTLEISKQDEKDLIQIFNRSGKSYGYLDGVQNNKDSISYETAKNTGLVLGKVLDKNKRFIKVKLQENIDLHDGLEVHGKNVASTIVTCIKNEKNTIINKEMEKGKTVWLGDINTNVNIGDTVYKTSSKKLNDKLKDTFTKENLYTKRNKVKVNLIIKENEKMYGKVVSEDNKKSEVILDYIPSKAKTVAITSEDIKEKFKKVKDSVFIVDKINVDIDNNLYIPVSKINELRRNLLDKLEEQYIENKDVIKCYDRLKKEMDKLEKLQKMTFDYNKAYIKKTAYIYEFSKDKDYEYISKEYERIYIEAEDFARFEKKIVSEFAINEIYIMIPNVILKNLEKYLDNNLENLFKKYPNIKGIVISNIGYLEKIKEYKEKYDLDIVADYQLNATNVITFEMLKEYGVDRFALMPDLEDYLIEKFIKMYNVEIIKSYVTVMTSRYCVLGSFLSNNKEHCEMPCQKDKYSLIDFKNEKLYIISRPLDCVMRLVKKLSETKYNNQKYLYINKRECIL